MHGDGSEGKQRKGKEKKKEEREREREREKGGGEKKDIEAVASKCVRSCILELPTGLTPLTRFRTRMHRPPRRWNKARQVDVKKKKKKKGKAGSSRIRPRNRKLRPAVFIIRPICAYYPTARSWNYKRWGYVIEGLARLRRYIRNETRERQKGRERERERKKGSLQLLRSNTKIDPNLQTAKRELSIYREIKRACIRDLLSAISLGFGRTRFIDRSPILHFLLLHSIIFTVTSKKTRWISMWILISPPIAPAAVKLPDPSGRFATSALSCPSNWKTTILPRDECFRLIKRNHEWPAKTNRSFLARVDVRPRKKLAATISSSPSPS